MEIEKIQALAIHLDIDYFEHNDQYYTGATQEEYEEFEKKELENEEDTNTAFNEWIDGNYDLLEDEFEVSKYDDCLIEYGNQEYLVCTDEEAEDKWDEDLENYIDECVIGELPERYQSYFNRNAFKRDCRIDGRGHSLARYDGEENEIEISNTWYYIYRTN